MRGKPPSTAAAILVLVAAEAVNGCVKPVVVVEPPSTVNVLAHIEPPPLPPPSTPTRPPVTPASSPTTFPREPTPPPTPTPAD